MARVIADRYRVDQHLALINNTEFYNGFDLQMQQPVIVRLIDLQHKDQKSLSRLEQLIARELPLMQKFMPPTMLQIRDFGLQGSIYYQINEFVNFRTLRDEITQTPCDMKTALHYGRDLADILAQLHKTYIIHRAITPDSILVTEDGFKLMEFYVANLPIWDEPITRITSYMSPEAIQGEYPVSAAWDVWSFGILLYELLTGAVPCPIPAGEDGQEGKFMLVMKILKEPVPPLEDAVPNLPPRLVTLIHAMLEKDSAKRISDMNIVMQELDAILSEFSLS